MIEAQLDALEVLLQRVPAAVDLALIGSLNHVLQGVPLDHVGDVDIVTDLHGALTVEKELGEYLIRPGHDRPGGRAQSRFSVFRVKGVDLEMMAEMRLQLDDGSWSEVVDVTQHRHWISVKSLRVPVMDLSWEAWFYERLGRHQRVDVLRNLIAPGPPD